MKFYNYIFKSPLLLAMIAIFVLSVTKVDIYGEIFIFLIISLIYTLKQEDIPNQWFKIKFALYYTLFYTIRNIIKCTGFFHCCIYARKFAETCNNIPSKIFDCINFFLSKPFYFQQNFLYNFKVCTIVKSDKKFCRSFQIFIRKTALFN